MVLRLLRDLLNMAFKVINENASHDRQECQLLVATLRSPNKTVGHNDSTWIVEVLTTAKNCPMPYPLPGSCPNCGHCWVDCCALPGQYRSVFPSSSSIGKSLRPSGFSH